MEIPRISPERRNSFIQRAHYNPPWANTSVIGIAGSSGSGKTSLAIALIEQLNLPWVVILSMDSFYKPLNKEESERAFRNEYDFDSPEAIDFDLLVEKLRELKAGKRVEIPIYSFEKHNREKMTTSIYSPHVVVLEGIFALHDRRVLDMLDLKIFADAEPDLCLSRRLIRDVKERGRDIQGCIKQWFSYVKPNYLKYVEPQRAISDIIIPRGIENSVAINMVSDHIRKTLAMKSSTHTTHLKDITPSAPLPLPPSVHIVPSTPQTEAMHTTLLLPSLPSEDFIFTTNRICTILIEQALSLAPYPPKTIYTPQGYEYRGRALADPDSIAAAILLRGGSVLETALHRVLPSAPTARLLIQNNYRTGEPELHYTSAFPESLKSKDGKPANTDLVLLLDSQMASGGAALMAVRVLIDHGVPEDKIVVVAYLAGASGLGRLCTVFPNVRVVVGRISGDEEERWVEKRYLGC